MNKRQTGARYEDIAVSFLESNGTRVIKRNFRCRIGEIDIIGFHEGVLVFFEVKYRNSEKYGNAAEAVGEKKKQVISKVSDYFRCINQRYMNYPIRYDVIAIQNEEIFWYKNAFEYAGNSF
ncbi:MAG: YraN family protein [Lachnospiraceae bacterium]|nr:YraN family protein [Lachnospiraceae bacterium]